MGDFLRNTRGSGVAGDEVLRQTPTGWLAEQHLCCTQSRDTVKSVALRSPEEQFSFRIPGYGLDHQGGAITDLLVELDFKEDVGVIDPFAYPEFVSIVNFIKNYLGSYPNETDFWEILNRNLVNELLTRSIPTPFGVEYQLGQLVDALTLNLRVASGSSLVNFPRQSEVVGSPDGAGIDFVEGFSFQIPAYGLDHQGGAIVNLSVDLDFKKDIGVEDPFAYPEFVSIVNFIKNYLVAYPNETDYWEILNRNLVTALLTQKIPTTFGVEYQLANIVEALTVDLEVQSGSALVDVNRASRVTGSPAGSGLGGSGIAFDESLSFSLSDYGLDHQGGAIVDIQFNLDFKEDIGIDNPFAYPDYVSILAFVKDYLVAYPNETDFWEILNKNLVTVLLTQSIPTDFGVEYSLDDLVDSLTVDIQVAAGSSLVAFNRASRVTGSPDGTEIDFDASFSFEISDYGLDHQGGAIVDILVDLEFREGIGVTSPFEYPEFVSIVNFIKDYLIKYPNETDFWEILNKNLAAALLTETIPTNFGVEYHLADVVDTVTVDIQVQPGSSLVNFPRSSRVSQSVETGAELINIAADVFRISAPAAGPSALQIRLTQSDSASVNDLAVFRVDDAQGRIDGLDPGASGYLQAALARASNGLASLAIVPDGFDPTAAVRSLALAPGESFRFLLIQNDSLDNIRASNRPAPPVLFGSPETLQITSSARGVYSLTWRDGNGGAIKDAVLNIEASELPLPLGAAVQDQSQAELLDLRSVDAATTVQASFQIYREAAFDNVVGFYAISDVSGTILDPLTGSSLRPGDSRYAEVAVANRIAGLDLRVANQATASREAALQGGSLLAPFLVVNGTPEELFDADPNNDPAVYFPFLTANADGVDHIRLLGNNSFAFEDLAGGGDLDCNDVIVKVALASV